MCNQCDYEALLNQVNLDPTPQRLRVLEVVGNNSFPLSALEIYQTLARSHSISKVTVYRILDLLVSKKIVDRISTGGRSAYFGLAPNANHRAHPHFYCKLCGQMDCLSPESLNVDFEAFKNTFPGRIDKIEMRLDGICKNCLRRKRNNTK